LIVFIPEEMLSHDVLACGAWLPMLRLNPGFVVETTVDFANADSAAKKGPGKRVH
jgi:hypothetical protein